MQRNLNEGLGTAVRLVSKNAEESESSRGDGDSAHRSGATSTDSAESQSLEDQHEPAAGFDFALSPHNSGSDQGSQPGVDDGARRDQVAMLPKLKIKFSDWSEVLPIVQNFCSLHQVSASHEYSLMALLMHTLETEMLAFHSRQAVFMIRDEFKLALILQALVEDNGDPSSPNRRPPASNREDYMNQLEAELGELLQRKRELVLDYIFEHLTYRPAKFRLVDR